MKEPAIPGGSFAEKEKAAWLAAGKVYRQMEDGFRRRREERAIARRTEIEEWKIRLIDFVREHGGVHRFQLDTGAFGSLNPEEREDAAQAFDQLETEGIIVSALC